MAKKKVLGAVMLAAGAGAAALAVNRNYLFYQWILCMIFCSEFLGLVMKR